MDATHIIAPTREIQIASEAHQTYVRHLSNKFRSQLGFIPNAGLDAYCANGWALIGHENGDPAGYILGRPSLRWMPRMRSVIHAAVQMDAQRRQLGLEMLKVYEHNSRANGIRYMQAMCRYDLDANEFWLAAGYEKIAQLSVCNAKKQPMICWRKTLDGTHPMWWTWPPPRAGHKPTRTGTREQLKLW